MNMSENTFSPLYPHFWRKLSIGRQGLFELRRIIEHCGLYAIKFMKFHLIIGFGSRFRPEFLRPFFHFNLSSIAKLRDQVSHLL